LLDLNRELKKMQTQQYNKLEKKERSLVNSIPPLSLLTLPSSLLPKKRPSLSLSPNTSEKKAEFHAIKP
jgi:hypothetical protein